MKKMKNLLLLATALSTQALFAQTGAPLKLSNEHPAAGEKVSFTYDPSGTPLSGRSDIDAAVVFLDGKDYPAQDIDLKQDGKFLKGDFEIPAAAKAFYIRLEGRKVHDNNNEKGYLYLVYKDARPVQYACVLEAQFLMSMNAYYAGIKSDNKTYIDLYEKEFEKYPGSKKDYESNYLRLIARAPEKKSEILKKIAALKKSPDEKELLLASALLEQQDKTESADSLRKIIKGRFPNGELVKNDMMTAIYRERDIHKMDSLFALYEKKFPESPLDPSTLLDNLRLNVAYAMFRKNDEAGFKKYASQMTDKLTMAGIYNSIAWESAVAGKNLDEAEKLAKQSVDIYAAKLDNPAPSPYTSLKMAKKNAQGDWNAAADTYAYLLWKENKSNVALPYMKKVYDLTSDEVNSIEHYSEVLAGSGQYDKAMEVIEKGYREGQSSDATKDELKKDYIKVKGSDAGFDQYLVALETAAKAKTLALMAQTMLNKPAPLFTLKDLDGNTVSLADLKGKVVIVDFWATWCGPCVGSFPDMQKVVDKYKDNPNVKFLFVNTLERGKNYEPNVRKFISDKKYTFRVLLDEKNNEGRQAQTVEAYGVDGIPTKFIIDKKGIIRFKTVGGSISFDTTMEELSNMIDLANNPALANADSPKQGDGK